MEAILHSPLQLKCGFVVPDRNYSWGQCSNVLATTCQHRQRREASARGRGVTFQELCLTTFASATSRRSAKDCREQHSHREMLIALVPGVSHLVSRFWRGDVSYHDARGSLSLVEVRKELKANRQTHVVWHVTCEASAGEPFGSPPLVHTPMGVSLKPQSSSRLVSGSEPSLSARSADSFSDFRSGSDADASTSSRWEGTAPLGVGDGEGDEEGEAEAVARALISLDTLSYLHFSIDLVEGDFGPEVKKLQTALVHLGHLEGGGTNITGYYGTLTKRAVQRFQVAHALPPSGCWGELSRRAYYAHVELLQALHREQCEQKEAEAEELERHLVETTREAQSYRALTTRLARAAMAARSKLVTAVHMPTPFLPPGSTVPLGASLAGCALGASLLAATCWHLLARPGGGRTHPLLPYGAAGSRRRKPVNFQKLRAMEKDLFPAARQDLSPGAGAGTGGGFWDPTRARHLASAVDDHPAFSRSAAAAAGAAAASGSSYALGAAHSGTRYAGGDGGRQMPPYYPHPSEEGAHGGSASSSAAAALYEHASSPKSADSYANHDDYDTSDHDDYESASADPLGTSPQRHARRLQGQIPEAQGGDIWRTAGSQGVPTGSHWQYGATSSYGPLTNLAAATRSRVSPAAVLAGEVTPVGRAFALEKPAGTGNGRVSAGRNVGWRRQFYADLERQKQQESWFGQLRKLATGFSGQNRQVQPFSYFDSDGHYYAGAATAGTRRTGGGQPLEAHQAQQEGERLQSWQSATMRPRDSSQGTLRRRLDDLRKSAKAAELDRKAAMESLASERTRLVELELHLQEERRAARAAKAELRALQESHGTLMASLKTKYRSSGAARAAAALVYQDYETRPDA
eukprot:jgi/Mesen1/6059/ME000309S05191